jgi:hypothetical protein
MALVSSGFKCIFGYLATISSLLTSEKMYRATNPRREHLPFEGLKKEISKKEGNDGARQQGWTGGICLVGGRVPPLFLHCVWVPHPHPRQRSLFSYVFFFSTSTLSHSPPSSPPFAISVFHPSYSCTKLHLRFIQFIWSIFALDINPSRLFGFYLGLHSFPPLPACPFMAAAID